MSLQIGTVDGLINITEEKIKCFVKAIISFANGGVERSSSLNISLGSAFQRYVEPVYKGYKDDFDLDDINIPVYTKGRKEQSPARVTFCKKMGLLYIDDDKRLFKPTLICEAIYNGDITIRDYAFILLSKQGVFANCNYKTNLFVFISNWFLNHSSISEEELKREITSNFNDSNIEKTRLDIILNAFTVCGILSCVGRNIYVIADTIAAKIFDCFSVNESVINPALLDSDINYADYISSFKNGVFDLLYRNNTDCILKKFPNLKKYKKSICSVQKEYKNQMLQQIYYGAPGTGKSNEIKLLTGKGNAEYKFSKNFTFRTTFHPDSDYSSFVGCYKPTQKENSNGQLTYAFTPQSFTKAYVAAWTNPNQNVALVIEEINRGNCAQIFGDIFQLLDRESNGLSKYPIEADIDLQTYLKDKFSDITFDDNFKDAINLYYEDHYEDAFKDIRSGKILALPTNLSILCTMNTSDQSLFPMDSAFKRRWDWQYMPIKNAGLDWKIELDENYEKIDWWDFLKSINKVVADLTTSEDKQLGYFFCQPNSFIDTDKRSDNNKPNLITAKHFVDKVIFYLWNDVFKDYAFDASCCKDENGKEVLFAQFYNEDGKSVNIETLKHFFDTLKSEQEPSLVVNIPIEDSQDEPEAE